jgi:chromosome segregation ATPase
MKTKRGVLKAKIRVLKQERDALLEREKELESANAVNAKLADLRGTEMDRLDAEIRILNKRILEMQKTGRSYLVWDGLAIPRLYKQRVISEEILPPTAKIEQVIENSRAKINAKINANPESADIFRRYEAVTKERDEVKTKLEEVDEELQKVLINNGKLIAEITAAKKNIQTLETRCRGYSIKLQEDVAGRDKTIEDLEKRNNNLEKQRQDLYQRIDIEKAANLELREKLDEAESRISVKEQEVDIFKLQASEEKTLKDMYALRCTGLENQIAKDDHITIVKEKANARITQLEALLEKSREERNEALTRVKELEHEKQTALDDYGRSARDYHETIENLKKEIEDKQARLDKLLEQTKEERDEANARIFELEQDKAIRLDDYERRAKEYQETIVKLNKEIESLAFPRAKAERERAEQFAQDLVNTAHMVKLEGSLAKKAADTEVADKSVIISNYEP